MFSVSDPNTARFLSDRIGETEFLETEESHSMGVEDGRDGLSLSRRRKTEKLLMSSEIMGLKELTAYAKLPNYDLTKITLIPKTYPDLHEPLIIRPELNLANIAEQVMSEADSIGEKVIQEQGKEDEKRIEDLDRAVADEVEREMWL
jgi:type IV secretory pathway TraG/TraD family ATPase VirD4